MKQSVCEALQYLSIFCSFVCNKPKLVLVYINFLLIAAPLTLSSFITASPRNPALINLIHFMAPTTAATPMRKRYVAGSAFHRIFKKYPLHVSVSQNLKALILEYLRG